MPEFSTPVVGNFCWIEANVDDPQGEKRFYGELFGWTWDDMPMGDVGTYTLLKLGEKQVAGLVRLPDNAKKMATPSHWLQYVAVNEVDTATKKAQGLGAKVLLPPKDAGMGRMSVLLDPTGAMLALWQQGKESGGVFLYGENNSLCWNELVTTDLPAATKFYVGLFGWKAEMWPMGEFEYTVLKNGDHMVGGLMPKLASMPAEMPSVWTAYFAVTDCDASAKRAEKLGARLITPPKDIPDVGRFAILTDPDGAAFAIIKSFPPSAPLMR